MQARHYLDTRVYGIHRCVGVPLARAQLRIAMKNGVEKDELIAMITHVAFYADWPAAVNAGRVALDKLQEDE